MNIVARVETAHVINVNQELYLRRLEFLATVVDVNKEDLEAGLRKLASGRDVASG